MKSKLLKNIFSSGLQAIAVQVLGVLFFLITATYMPKNDFGIINWATATAAIITTLLSFGMEQVVFRRIAASNRSDWAASAFMIHAIVGSAISFIILLLLPLFLHKDGLQYLPWFFAAQSLMFIAIPLKQMLNAKQKFTPYGIIAIVGNCMKILLAFLYLKSSSLTIERVYIILIICSLIEFVSLFIFIKKNIGLRLSFRFKAYAKLLQESLPQYVSVIFDSSLSRLDWFLLGIIATNSITAEYTFAYKALEIGRLPITIIAPILLARFAKILGANISLNQEREETIRHVFSIEVFLAMMIPLIMNILWVPVLDVFFHGKYGSSNATELLLLSINIPMLFCINLLWTICFTGKAYRKIANVTISSAIINLGLNLILIPAYDGKGAAIAFLITTIFQMTGYYYIIRKQFMSLPILNIVICFVLAAIAYIVTGMLEVNVIIQLLLAIISYIGMGIFCKQIGKEHLITLQLFLKK